MKYKKQDDSCVNSESLPHAGTEEHQIDTAQPAESTQAPLSKRLLEKLRRLKEEDPDIYPLF